MRTLIPNTFLISRIAFVAYYSTTIRELYGDLITITITSPLRYETKPRLGRKPKLSAPKQLA